MKITESITITSYANMAVAIARFNNIIDNNLLNSALDTLQRIVQVADENMTIV
ncbi:hypothetical protein [Candidatus Profftia lariciata]|uniref:hypothetical protein n=1 Tax=Candidatus Profftia lariciata TaxID=1987921 RepID=UPI001D028A33|nr:hypothetical protein [Candidatus Profftia lariciata]